MEVPNELLLAVLQRLRKADLKSARLVSKRWSMCAAEYLFAKIFVSPHELNLQVFEAICKHPILRKCVKELEYDGVYFRPNLEFSEYIEQLWQTYRTLTLLGRQWPRQTTEERKLDFVAMVAKDYYTDVEFEEVKKECRGFLFVKDGYQQYLVQARFQEDCFCQPMFRKNLIEGLRMLDRLESVTINSQWNILGNQPSLEWSGRRPNGSPLARIWDCFYSRPHGWSWESEDMGNAYLEYWTLTLALSKACRQIQSLSTFKATKSLTDNAKPFDTHSLSALRKDAYSKLKTLKLFHSVRMYYPETELYKNWDGMGELLTSLPTLEHLELNLPRDGDDNKDPVWIPYAHIFPKTPKWPRLITFVVRNMVVGIRDFLCLLMVSMPRLKHLSLRDIDLQDGRWESFVEVLHHAGRLSSLCLADGCSLLYRDHSRVLRYESNDNNVNFVALIEDYVVKRPRNPMMRHPSLKPSQCMEKSLDYIIEVFRLCEASGMDDTTSELMTMMKEHQEQTQREQWDIKRQRQVTQGVVNGSGSRLTG